MKKTLNCLWIMFFCGSLLGCAKSEFNRVLLTVKDVSESTLMQQSSELKDRTKMQEGEGNVLDLNQCPPSFLAFKPVEVIYHGTFFFIVTSRNYQHRSGLVVATSRKELILDGSGFEIHKISNGIFYVET